MLRQQSVYAGAVEGVKLELCRIDCVSVILFQNLLFSYIISKEVKTI